MERLKTRQNTKWVAVNGGWGWFVVFGVAISNMFIQSLISIFGLIFGEEITNMGYGTTEAALVMNAMSFITNFSGFITGPVIKKFGYRKTAVTGSVLASVGLILSSQATKMWHLLIAYSFLSGLGLGLIAPSNFVAVNSYFTSNKGRAVGIAMAGTGFGQMIMPHIVRYLLEEYGYRGATFILGGLALNGIVGASLFQPIKWHMKQVEINESDALISHPKSDMKLTNVVDSPTPEPKTLWAKISKTLDLNLLKDPVFLNITIGLSLVYTVSIFFSMLFPFFLQIGAGLTRGQTASCMSVLAGADILSRLTIPTFSKWIGIGARTTFFFGIFGLAMARSYMALQSDYMTLIVASAITGYIRATTVVNINLTIAEYVSQEQVPCALGLNMVNKGLTVITVGHFLGWVRDYTDSFEFGIHVSSLILLLVYVMWLPEMIWKACKRKIYSEIPRI